jgi:hypothetical protein
MRFASICTCKFNKRKINSRHVAKDKLCPGKTPTKAMLVFVRQQPRVYCHCLGFLLLIRLTSPQLRYRRLQHFPCFHKNFPTLPPLLYHHSSRLQHILLSRRCFRSAALADKYYRFLKQKQILTYHTPVRIQVTSIFYCFNESNY